MTQLKLKVQILLLCKNINNILFSATRKIPLYMLEDPLGYDSALYNKHVQFTLHF